MKWLGGLLIFFVCLLAAAGGAQAQERNWMCHQNSDGDLACDKLSGAADALDDGERTVVCVTGQDGEIHCGHEIKREKTCIVDNKGNVWCGDKVARASFGNFKYVCVTEPCHETQVKREDIMNGIREQLDAEISRYQAERSLGSD